MAVFGAFIVMLVEGEVLPEALPLQLVNMYRVPAVPETIKELSVAVAFAPES
jgi:hypothetical protein